MEYAGFSYTLFCRFSSKLISSLQNRTFWKEWSASLFSPHQEATFVESFKVIFIDYAAREKAKLSLIISLNQTELN